MAGTTRTLYNRLIASGALARVVLLMVGIGGVVSAWLGSVYVRTLFIQVWSLLLALAPSMLIIGLAVFGLMLTTTRAVLCWRRRRQDDRQAALAQGMRQGRAALLEEVRVVVHGHLKPYIVEVEHRLADVRRATDVAQQELLLRELDYSVQRLRQQIIELHGQVAAPMPPHATACPDDLERTLREVTWNFRSLLPRCTLEVAGLARPISHKAASALELMLYNALTNAHSHAQARMVQVRLRYDLDAVTLTVSDDGCGFDVARMRAGAHGRGLHDLERAAADLAGRLTIFSTTERGTAVTMTLPLPRPQLGWAAGSLVKENTDGSANASAPAVGAHGYQ